jgi:hypothetical protein
MRLDLQRFSLSGKSTIGLLSVNGQPECFTLEDPVRREKIQGETAIPAGSYKVVLRANGGMIGRYHQRFGEVRHPGMLWLLDVPDFTYVYIHIGNVPKDTQGCILVANAYDFRNPDVIGVSTDAYLRLYDKVWDAIDAGEEVTIDVS